MVFFFSCSLCLSLLEYKLHENMGLSVLSILRMWNGPWYTVIIYWTPTVVMNESRHPISISDLQRASLWEEPQQIFAEPKFIDFQFVK